MIDVYAKCSRCGEMFEGDSKTGSSCFESARFFRTYSSGTAYNAIERYDKTKQEEFRQAYPLCPDCLADTLDFVRGKYRAVTHEDVCESGGC